MSDKPQQNVSAVNTPAPIVSVTPAKKKKEVYPFWLGGVAASIAASITQCVYPGTHISNQYHADIIPSVHST